MKKIAVVGLYLFVLILPQLAQGQTPPLTKKQELIKEMVALTTGGNNANKILDAMLGEFRKQYPQIIEAMADSEKDLSDAQRKQMKDSAMESYLRFSKAFEAKLKERIDLNKLVEEVSLSIYDKYFTEDELKDLIAFYKTPAGQKAISIMPQVMAESVRQTNEKLTPIMTAILTEILAEEEQRLKSGNKRP